MNSPAGKGLETSDGNTNNLSASCTPTHPKQNTSMGRTPYSGMSSSLRERLKKCGRYHPATPPSSRQATPSSYQATPISSEVMPISSEVMPISTQATPTSTQATPTSTQAMPSSSQATPTFCQQHERFCEANSVNEHEEHTTSVSCCPASSVTTLYHSPTSSKTTQPQPRNILMKTSNSSFFSRDSTRTVRKRHTKQEVCADIYKVTMSKLDDSIDDEDKRSMSKLDNSDDDITDKGNISELDSSMDQTRSNQGIPLNTSESNSSAVIEDNVVCLTDSTNKQTPGSNKTQTDSELWASAKTVDSASLRETKKKLTAELADRKEVLRKLNMVRTYRAKHDLEELQSLINKWRSASQQAVLDLHGLTHDPRPSLTQLVQQLGVDQKLLCYNREDECFEDD